MREDGAVLVTMPPAIVEQAPMLAPDLRRGMDVVIERWGALCDAAADKYSIPRGWLEAMIWRESAGNQRAFRQEPNGWTGVGLLQITAPALKGRLTDEQLYDPSTNIDVGARYVASLREKYGNDFPRVSAAFNAGSVRPDDGSPWGMHATSGHVSSEVSAINYYLLRKETDRQHELVYLVDVAVREEFDLSADLGLLEPLAPEERPTEPDPVREAVTMPDLATLPRKPEEA